MEGADVALAPLADSLEARERVMGALVDLLGWVMAGAAFLGAAALGLMLAGLIEAASGGVCTGRCPSHRVSPTALRRSGPTCALATCRDGSRWSRSTVGPAALSW